tara:strand:- start:1316 stop:1606 length:291 start_codon:yes stop_codon:yes gene_type:complete
MKRELLTAEQLLAVSREMPEWAVATDGLERTFEFGDFIKAFSFMSAVATHCERLDHHPEWSNVYGTVRVRLTTHDRGGVTDLDVTMAELMEGLAHG